MGTALLERRASGSYLTDAGQLLYRRTRRMIAQMEVALIELGCQSVGGDVSAVANRLSRSQLRGLLAIVDYGSFSAAAERMSVTQASLQRAARDLESNLHKTIYHRTAAGVMVTQDGVEFSRRIKLAIQEIEWGIREITAAQGVASSQITIGALPFGGAILLASLLDEFIASHADADIRILTEGAAEMLKRLRVGEVDLVIGIIQDAMTPDLKNEAFAPTPYVIAGREGHPLTMAGRVSIAELSGFDWVVGAEGSSRRTCFEALFSGHALPKSRIATSSLTIIRHLLADSDRLTVMTSYELEQEGEALTALPYTVPFQNPAIGVTMRADWLPTKLHREFIELLRSRIAATLVPR